MTEHNETLFDLIKAMESTPEATLAHPSREQELREALETKIKKAA